MAEPILPQSSDSATVTLPPDLTQLGRDLYAELRRRWVAGGRRPFLAPHRELAELLGCSPAAIAPHMQHFARWRLITRTPYRNKYLIAIPDGPSAFDPPLPSADRSASSPDRSVATRPLVDRDDPPTAEPDSAAERGAGSSADVIDQIRHNGTHDLKQQQQQSSDSWAGRQGDQAALRAELAKDDAEVVAELFRRHPTITLTEFAREVVAAESRPNVFCPRAVALKALSSGERVRGARASPPPGPTGDPPAERSPRRPKDRWADDRPATLSREWATFLAEQEARDRRYAQRLGQEAPHAATT